MNRGTANGLSTSVWQRFKPTMKCVGGTDPFLDDTGSMIYQTGQSLLRPDGRVEVIMQTQFVGSATIGSGGPYAFKLPYPAFRPSGSNTTCPMPIGIGQCYISIGDTSVPDVNCDVIPTLSDPSTSIDHPDLWFQAYAPYVLDWGTASMTTGNGSVTVNHNVGYAPNAQDISISLTNNGASSASSRLGTGWIDTITTTQFTFHRGGAATTGTETLSYKIRAEPPSGSTGALISPTVPWAWSHTPGTVNHFGNFFFHLKYRARR